MTFVLDSVRSRDDPPSPRRLTVSRSSSPSRERGSRAGVLLVKAPHQVREHALGPFVIFGFERVLQDALDRPPLALRQRVQHVPFLVLLASLDERASPEDRPHSPVKGLAAVDHDENGPVGGQAPRYKVLQQGRAGGLVLRRPFPEPEHVLPAFPVDTPTSICSIARSSSGSLADHAPQLGSDISLPEVVRTRGRFTLTSRPPNTRELGTRPPR